MPDISMCMNEKCKLKTNCKRFMATPSPFQQAYMAFRFETENGVTTCENFIEWPDK